MGNFTSNNTKSSDELSENKKIYYTKKQMCDELCALQPHINIIHPLCMIICDYAYQIRYKKIASYYSNVWNEEIKDYCSILYKNYFIEHGDSNIYAHDILKNKCLETYDIRGYSNEAYSLLWAQLRMIESNSIFFLF
jgi:hypothetical protein